MLGFGIGCGGYFRVENMESRERVGEREGGREEGREIEREDL